MVLAILLLKTVQPSSELCRGGVGLCVCVCCGFCLFVDVVWVFFPFFFLFFLVAHFWAEWGSQALFHTAGSETVDTADAGITGPETHEGINGQISSVLLIAELLVVNIYCLVLRKEEPKYTGTFLKRMSCKLHWKWKFDTINSEHYKKAGTPFQYLYLL